MSTANAIKRHVKEARSELPHLPRPAAGLVADLCEDIEALSSDWIRLEDSQATKGTDQ